MSPQTVTLEQALVKLRDAYAAKKYKEVVAMGNKILEAVPEQAEAKELVHNAQQFLTASGEKKGSWTVVGGIVLILFVLLGLWGYQWLFVNPAYQGNAEAQSQKYNTLVKENGFLQIKNNEISSQVEWLKGQVSMLSLQMQNLTDKLNRRRPTTSTEKDQMIASLQAKIDEQNNKMQQLINLTVQQTKEQPQKFVYGENMMNFLIVGDHGGLTDTIMIAAVNPSLKTISLLSVPRDLYVNGRKLNTIYRDFGVDTLEVYLHDITGLVITNYVHIDLQGFVQIIDLLGGVDVEVDKTIEDKKYPTEDGGIETFTLAAGWQHLDGATALKYARTRHGNSDFDRAKRQQKVMRAVLDKVNALGLADVNKLLELGNTVLANVRSSVNLFQALGYYQDFKDFRLEGGNVLSTANYLYSSQALNNDYILLPKDNSYEQIQEFVYGVVMK